MDRKGSSGAYRRLGLIATADCFPLTSDVGEEGSTGAAVITLPLGCFGVAASPVDGLVESAPSGGDRGSPEEGDGDEGFD